MARPSVKGKIVKQGMELVRRNGYYATGVRDITREADVPLGSFSNHFVSKEAFAAQIIDACKDEIDEVMMATLGQPGTPPLDRLRSYFEAIIDDFEQRDWQHGCLVGNMSLEAAPHSEPLREQISEVFGQWNFAFAVCLEEAVEAGDVVLPMPAAEIADFLMASWEGAILRMKVEHSPAPLQRFVELVFGTVLAPRRTA